MLQIRKPNYWRIEVPIESPHEQDLAHALRLVLDQILQFEKTACPFKRSFTVQLPQRPQTPVIKKPWTPVQGPLPPLSTPEQTTSPTPKPKSLRSAEKKVERRPSAALEQSPVKEAADVEDLNTTSASISKLAGAETEETISQISETAQIEEDRGRPLTRDDAVESPQEMLVSATDEEQETSELIPETPLQPDQAGNLEDSKPMPEGPDEVEEVLAEPTIETPAVQPEIEEPEPLAGALTEESKSADSNNSTEVEEPWSAHSLGGFGDSEQAEPPVQPSLGDEPWSAHSTGPIIQAEATVSKEEGASEQLNIPHVTETVSEEIPRNDESAVTESDAQVLAVGDDSEPSTTPGEVTPRPSAAEKQEEVQAVQATSNNAPDTETVVVKTDHQQPAERRTSTSTAAPSVKRLSLRSDKFEGILPYDQKSAAGTITSLDVASRVTQDKLNEPVSPEDDKLSTSSRTSSFAAPSEEVLSGGPLESEVHEGSGMVGARRKKLRGFHGSRSLAVPPQLTLVTSPPSKSAASKQSPRLQAERSDGSTSPTGSQDSFYSVQSWHSPITPLPPSPPASDPTTPSTFPYPHDNIKMPKRMSRYEMSDMTVTPDTRRTWDAASSGTQDSSQESAATAPDVDMIGAFPVDKPAPETEAASTSAAPQRPQVRHRATASTVSRRALSPLPPAANLFSPTSATSRRRPNRSPLELVRRVPMAIIAKTCEILLSPPSHLVNLMLRVAAKITAGEWRGVVFGYGEAGEAIPVEWDYSEGELSADDDDYYVNHASARVGSLPGLNARAPGRSWEVD